MLREDTLWGHLFAPHLLAAPQDWSQVPDITRLSAQGGSCPRWRWPRRHPTGKPRRASISTAQQVPFTRLRHVRCCRFKVEVAAVVRKKARSGRCPLHGVMPLNDMQRGFHRFSSDFKLLAYIIIGTTTRFVADKVILHRYKDRRCCTEASL